MTHEEIVNLIRAGVPSVDAPSDHAVWADFGAGRGAFTRALRELLGPAATVYALDKNAAALRAHPPDIRTITADFTSELPDLPPLDGLLMANALHFVRRQGRVFERMYTALKPGGRFIIVEYTRRLPWTPFPVTYDRFASLAPDAGFADVTQIGLRTSPRDGVSMYAGLALRPI